MSDYTYKLPFTDKQFLKGIIREVKRNGETQLYHCLKSAILYVDELGTSYYIGKNGRWDAIGINIKFSVHPRYIEELDDNNVYKGLLGTICNNLIPGQVGYDLKDIIFIPNLCIDNDEDDDIIYDLQNQIKNTSNKVLNKILPNDITIKGQEMAETYTYLYSVENSIRIFIEIVSKEKYGEDYLNKFVVTSALKKTISSRKEKARSSKWLSFRGDNDLFYLDFTDLGSIIESNWGIFEEYFNSQGFILPKLKEMAECRNLIAHNSYISKTERDLIKSYYNSIIMQISDKFIDIVDE